MRILVTGSREWEDCEVMENALALAADGVTHVIHGACPRGADALLQTRSHGRWHPGPVIERLRAHDWDRSVLWVCEPHPADWDRHGKTAGHVRNQEMADAGADLCLAFTTEWPPTPGTASMIDKAHKRGIPVQVYVAP